MKKIILAAFALFALCSTAAMANVILGRAVDESDLSPLPEATLKLVMANADSTFVAGVSSDSIGNFVFDKVPAGRYVIKGEYIGYHPLSKRVRFNGSNDTVSLGDVAFKASSVVLKEAVVVGVKTEVKVMEDTVEYNADSYKVQPNAVVEDLLKRLPGVEVGSDGKITAQGKEIKKILVDGKEFFGDDPQVASKNIPVTMVDKLQVVDRKSDLARLTGVDDGDDETVINLTVKKGMNNGWFGNVEAGYGTDDRYKANAMINYFRDGNQFTFIGGANNVNSAGFTDGGASRFGRFGGMSGINSTQNLGFNFNVGDKAEVFRVGGNVMYSHSSRDTRSTSARTYLFPDSTSYANSSSISNDKGNNIVGDFRLKWQPDSANTFEFRPNFSFNFSDSYKDEGSNAIAGDANRTMVNQSLGRSTEEGKSYEFGGQLVFNHKFLNHPGRSLSLMARYKYSNLHDDRYTLTRNSYYLLGDEETIDQIYNTHRWSNTVMGRLSWTEPLGDISNANFLQFSYRGNYNFQNSDKNVYDATRAVVRPGNSVGSIIYNADFRRAVKERYGEDALFDTSILNQILESEILSQDLNVPLSDQFRNEFYSQEIRAGFKKTNKMYNLDLGLALNSATQSSEDLLHPEKTIDTRTDWYLAPYARLKYKFSKSESLDVNYRSRSSQPSITQLQPVADVSNPLNIVVGNPDLKSTFNNSLNVRYNNFDQKSQRSVMAMVNGQFSSNSIVSRTTYNSQTGGRETTYENVNGVWSIMGMAMVNFPLRNKSFYFNSHVSANYSSTKGYNNDVLNTSGTTRLSAAPGITYRNSALELSLRPTYSVRFTNNSVQTSQDLTVHSYGGMFTGSYYAPFGLTMNTDLRYSATSGYSSGYDTKQWLWNASMGYQFLAGKSATVSVSVYDILGQLQSINRNVTANYISDDWTNTLTRYGMLTFTYKFTTFGSHKDNPKLNYGGFDDDRGPGRGPGDGGGRRMGPPPSGGGRPF